MGAERVDLLPQFIHFSGIEDGNHRILTRQEHCCGFTAGPGSKYCDRLSGVGGIQRSFKVANPSRANITDRIQNRTITVFSFHPFNSKWW